MTQLNDEQIDRACRVADQLGQAMDLDERLAPYRDRSYRDGGRATPTLHLEDVTGIPFVSAVPGVEEYQHRARVRADDGDLFAAVTPSQPGYETYNREVLGLGAPAFVPAEPTSGPMAVATACLEEPTFGRLVEHIPADALLLHPYMSIEPVWQLAASLRDHGIRASVLGPPPPVLWVANDKARVADVNRRLGRNDLNVETHPERTAKAMTDRLLEMADRFDHVALKRTRCASAMGNKVFDSETILRSGARDLLRRVHRFLETTEWEGDEAVLVVEWAEAVSSPSTQMWLPPAGTGPPQMQGVYEQILEGAEKIFVGSRPSTLPERVNRALVEASLLVSTTFQALGYVGRCSFDFVVTGDPDGDFEIRMIECNGRWGGTSTPMHLVDRLVDGPRPSYVAQDFVDPGLVGAEFPDILEATEHALYRPETGRGRFVFYNVGPLAEKGKLDVIALGDCPEEARGAVHEELPRLLGL